MALKGLDIFKLTPKTNCKECGNPTCMAFAMKVAQGSIPVDKCPHMSDDAKAALGEATAPPMKALQIGVGAEQHKLGGETVLFRHEKTFVSKNLFAVSVCPGCADERLPEIEKIAYERIGEKMYVELINLEYKGDAAAYAELVKKGMATGRTLILECADVEAANAALELCKDSKPILNGANASNFAAMVELAKNAGVVLGVSGANLDELYDTVKEIEKLGYKELVLDVTGASIKETFAAAVQVRHAALKAQDRSCGYPSVVNVRRLAERDHAMHTP
jgi:acetyl-CoA decarbonylase/synthase complex subunit gamma